MRKGCIFLHITEGEKYIFRGGDEIWFSDRLAHEVLSVIASPTQGVNFSCREKYTASYNQVSSSSDLNFLSSGDVSESGFLQVYN